MTTETVNLFVLKSFVVEREYVEIQSAENGVAISTFFPLEEVIGVRARTADGNTEITVTVGERDYVVTSAGATDFYDKLKKVWLKTQR